MACEPPPCLGLMSVANANWGPVLHCLPMPTENRNAQIVARSLAAVWHPCTQMKHHERFPLVPIVKGEGAWLIDAEGHRYLDAVLE